MRVTDARISTMPHEGCVGLLSHQFPNFFHVDCWLWLISRALFSRLHPHHTTFVPLPNEALKGDQSEFWWSKTPWVYFCAVDCAESLSQSPFRKGGQGDLQRVQVCDTHDSQRENLPPPLFDKEGSSADLAIPHQ